MNRTLSAREAAEAIEQFGDDLAALNRAFDSLCRRMPTAALDAINSIPDAEELDTIIDGFRAAGQRLSAECDEAEEALDRRRENPLEPIFGRMGR
jgi:hypothetical protein